MNNKHKKFEFSDLFAPKFKRMPTSNFCQKQPKLTQPAKTLTVISHGEFADESNVVFHFKMRKIQKHIDPPLQIMGQQ